MLSVYRGKMLDLGQDNTVKTQICTVFPVYEGIDTLCEKPIHGGRKMFWIIVMLAVAFIVGRHTRFSADDNPQPFIQLDISEDDEDKS